MPITPEQLKKALEKYATHPAIDSGVYIDLDTLWVEGDRLSLEVILDGDFDLSILASCLNEVIK